LVIEKPSLADEEILSVLRSIWGIDPGRLEFLPIGNDSRSWAYHTVTRQGDRFFVKLRHLPLENTTVEVPYFLALQGLNEVTAPIPGPEGQLWSAFGNFAVIVYPFIDGISGMDRGLSPQEWERLGCLLRKIHAAQLPGELLSKVPQETFVPFWLDTVRRVEQRIGSGLLDHPSQIQFATTWRKHTAEIKHVCGRAMQLGQQARAAKLKYVLCHADIHTANVMFDLNSNMHVVDWDGVIYAPPERDLMFMTNGIFPEKRVENERFFFKGYGEHAINLQALAYYRYEWCVQEIGDYGARVFFTPEAGEEMLSESVRDFEALFSPGDVIDGAYGMDNLLSESGC
jgi:spectinomycin phosphotransferase